MLAKAHLEVELEQTYHHQLTRQRRLPLIVSFIFLSLFVRLFFLFVVRYLLHTRSPRSFILFPWRDHWLLLWHRSDQPDLEVLMSDTLVRLAASVTNSRVYSIILDHTMKENVHEDIFSNWMTVIQIFLMESLQVYSRSSHGYWCVWLSSANTNLVHCRRTLCWRKRQGAPNCAMILESV